MKEDDKKKLQEHFMAMDEVLDTLTQEKKNIIQQSKDYLADLPLDMINDDPLDTDSEVLKSEEFHHSSKIKIFEYDINNLETFRLFLVYLREVLEKEGLIDRTTSSDDLKQYYDILESKETDSPEKIRAQFKKLIKFYHPDSYQNNPEKLVRAENKTKQLIDAHDELAKRGIL